MVCFLVLLSRSVLLSVVDLYLYRSFEVEITSCPLLFWP